MLERIEPTMTTIELFEMLDNYGEIKSLHLAIRGMFPEEIKDGIEIIPSIDSRG
jgi:hypothetical protein